MLPKFQWRATLEKRVRIDPYAASKMRHEPIHLKLDPKRDVSTYHFKRRKVYVLKMESGWRWLGSTVPTSICGVNARRVVSIDQQERVTCRACLRLLIVRFPKPVNPRSGMAMPRPT